jgi:hypothetical protein
VPVTARGVRLKRDEARGGGWTGSTHAHDGDYDRPPRTLRGESPLERDSVADVRVTVRDLVDAGAAEALYGEERDMAFEEAVAYVLRRE